MKGTKIFGALMLLLSLTQATKMLQNPLRVRLNSNLLRQLFHKKDQDLNRLFQNIELGDYSLGHSEIKDLKISFEPITGLPEDFDYRLSLDENTFLGIESDNLKIRGAGTINHGDSVGEEFTIEGPVKHFRVAYELKKDASKKI